MLFPPVRGEPVDRTGWSRARPGALIADIGPDPAFLDALAQPLVAPAAIENPDGRVIGVQKIAGHDLGLDLPDQRRQRLHRPAAPVHQGRVRDVRPHAGEDLVLTIQRYMVVEFRGQHISQKVRARHAAGNGTAGRRFLNDLFAAPAGFLDARNLDDLQLRRDHVDQLADIFAHHPQVAPAIRTIVAGIKLAAFARRVLRHLRAAAPRVPRLDRFRGLVFRLRFIVVVLRLVLRLGERHLQALQRQFQLFDLAFNLFRAGSEFLLLQSGDPDAQRLNQQIMGSQTGRHLLVFRLQCGDHRLQDGRIIGERRGFVGHGGGYHDRRSGAIKTNDSREIIQPVRAGGAPQSGRRQSIPSQSMAS